MTFEELQLCMAIDKAGRGSDTPTRQAQRIELALRVVSQWIVMTGESRFPFDVDDIVHCATRMRKNRDTRTKVAVAHAHGIRCFWEGRGKGPCCQNAECGHLWQNSEGGPLSVENCVIECRAHNNQRRAMTIEEYIKSTLTTEQNNVEAA
jgi:hypothetical protein